MIIGLAGKGETIQAINNLSRFEGLTHDEIVVLFVDCGAGQEIEKNLHKFSGLHISTVEKLITRGVATTVWKNISCFDPKDHQKIRSLLIDNGYSNTVLGF
ncbi:MAG: hypothetical protein LBI53_06535 [Candidatus Peribacteria bacterium]|nr:hypothetical protein [Candidatus Peribacteria bacterium]